MPRPEPSPQTDVPRREYRFGDMRVGPRARALVQQALDRNWVSAGENVRLFEEAWRARFDYREAVSASSGTAAVFTALAALHERGATWGDEVIVPALGFVATANAVLAAGFRPVFVDIRRETLNLDPDRIEAAITARTRAIAVVHTMGKPCDMDAVLGIAKRRGLRVVEDACEAHGAKHRGRYVGAIGDAGAFSFYAAHLVCTGEGGMVVTDDPDFARILRSVRSHGRPDGTLYFQFDRFGFNCKMNDLEAALGVEGTETFDAIFSARKRHLETLLAGMRDLEHVFHLLREEPHEVVSPHAFPLVFREGVKARASDLHAWLEERGCQVKTLFASLPTQHRVFRFLGHRLGDFPEAEYVGEKGLHVGCHQNLVPGDLDFLLEAVHEWVRRRL